MKKSFLLLLVLIITICLCACKKPSGDDRPLVCVSIVPQKAFADAIAKDKLNIVCLIPPGSSPETYELKPQQRASLEDCSLYLAIGVQAEASIVKLVNKEAKLISVDKEISGIYKDLSLGDERDPHIWLSINRVVEMVKIFEREFSLLDSANASFYKENSEKFISELLKTQSEIKQTISKLENKSFICFHPAFGYFADEFGLSMYALEEEGKQATASHMAQMVDFAKENGAKAIFYQAEVDSRQAQAFAEEIKGKTVQLDPLSYDYLSNMKKMAQTFLEVL